MCDLRSRLLVLIVVMAALAGAVGCGNSGGGSSGSDKIVGEVTAPLSTSGRGLVGTLTLRQYGDDDVEALIRNECSCSWSATLDITIERRGSTRSQTMVVEVLLNERTEELFVFNTSIELRRASVIASLFSFDLL